MNYNCLLRNIPFELERTCNQIENDNLDWKLLVLVKKKKQETWTTYDEFSYWARANQQQQQQQQTQTSLNISN